MSLKAILFDLDGTLLPMNLEIFAKEYLKIISEYLSPYGYKSEQLADTMQKSIMAMIKNNGSKYNEDIFWQTARSVIGDKIMADKPLFNKFYESEFDKVKAVCGVNNKAHDTVRALKQKGYRVVLATNPVFPKQATERRILWTNLTPEDFEFYTTYENSKSCKPNLSYYTDVASRLGVNANECLMVGNDVGDDMPAEKVGMKTFLLTDCLINTQNEDISKYHNGSFDELMEYINTLGV